MTKPSEPMTPKEFLTAMPSNANMQFLYDTYKDCYTRLQAAERVVEAVQTWIDLVHKDDKSKEEILKTVAAFAELEDALAQYDKQKEGE